MEATNKIQIKGPGMFLTFAGTGRSIWQTEMLNLTFHPVKKNKREILCTKAHEACCSHISSLLRFLYFAYLSSCPLHHPHTMEQQILVVLAEAFGASSAAKPWQRIPVTAMDSLWNWARRCQEKCYVGILDRSLLHLMYCFTGLQSKLWLFSSALSATPCFV